MTRTLPLVLAIVALAAPATALGATVGIESGTLRYTGGSGEKNLVGIAFQRDDGEYEIYESGSTAPAPPTRVETGPGCRRVEDPYQVRIRCSAAGVERIAVSLLDRDDALGSQSELPDPLTYSGGGGHDNVSYSVRGVNMSADGTADDGPSAQDNVQPDVEIMLGTPFADRLFGTAAGSELRGDNGDDTLVGGAGDDAIHAAYVETTGLDFGDFYASGTDTVRCGGGQDFAFADFDDLVGRDCEVVGRGFRCVSTGSPCYRYHGSDGDDRIVPVLFSNPARIRGRAGDDSIVGAYGDRVYGDKGDDRLWGSGGAILYGGRGKDVFGIRNGHHDTVHCGRGRDRVKADQRDRVARDCERVRRRTVKLPPPGDYPDNAG
jgi:Ca2+-binding RTX toxin-like protein